MWTTLKQKQRRTSKLQTLKYKIKEKGEFTIRKSWSTRWSIIWRMWKSISLLNFLVLLKPPSFFSIWELICLSNKQHLSADLHLFSMRMKQGFSWISKAKSGVSSDFCLLFFVYTCADVKLGHLSNKGGSMLRHISFSWRNQVLIWYRKVRDIQVSPGDLKNRWIIRCLVCVNGLPDGFGGFPDHFNDKSKACLGLKD